jgi:adenylate kinase
MSRGNLRLIFLGPPGSGKGTQASRLAEQFDLTHISSGDLFRAAAAADDELGAELRSWLDTGDLVPDELVFRMLSEPILEAERSGGYILDGFPRTLAQAEVANELAVRAGVTAHAVIQLEAPEDVLVGRLVTRGAVSHRADDREDVVRHRLEVHHSNEGPITEYYERSGRLHRIDATPEPDEVFEAILRVVEKIDRSAG